MHGRDEKCIQNFGRKNLQERDNSENLVMDGNIILKLILDIQDGKVWTGLIWLRIGSVAASCEHGNESSCSLKGKHFLTS
jgi:hypothetical protein